MFVSRRSGLVQSGTELAAASAPAATKISGQALKLKAIELQFDCSS